MAADKRSLTGNGQRVGSSAPKVAAGLPIRRDSAVEVTEDGSGKPEITSVKPIFRPPEKLTQPIKPYWAWIWLIIIGLVVVAWIFLYWYFSAHQAPYAAPPY